MNLEEKTNWSIRFIENLPILKDEKYLVAFSAGKDSVVLYDLCHKTQRTDLEYKYGNTTIDPKGTISFIKNNYPDVVKENPKTTFYKLIETRGLPTRISRFCCQELKEFYGIGRKNIEGIRYDESKKRQHNEPQICDNRKWMDGAQHIYPILGWNTEDIWGYIKQNNLPYMKYYDAPYNFKRHGCVGCPLAGSKQQKKEFGIFPKYAKLIIRAIKKNIELGNSLRIFNDEYEAFYWWIKQISIKKHFYNKGLFVPDYKLWVMKNILKEEL